MELKVSSSFFPLFARQERYLVLYGGRGSGKSEFAARKVLLRCWKEGNHRFLIMRKVRRSLQGSVIEVFLTLLNSCEIRYDYNKTDRSIKFYNSRGLPNELIFEGIDDPEKIKSIKNITSIWLEETTEFNKSDFITIDLSLREETPSYKQIIMTFNPDEARGPWIKNMFFDGIADDFIGPGSTTDSYLHHSTLKDNPIDTVKDDYQNVLDRLDDKTHISIFRLGRWAIAKDIIYNWNLVQLPTPDFSWFDEIFYGVDFGYSVDPAVLVRIYRKSNEFWAEQLIYERGLTNPQFARIMKEKGISDTDDVYCDSAEPKSIQELKDNGINAKPARKGADSVKAGIDYLKSLTIHIVDGGDYWNPDENIWKERCLYKWKEDKDGNVLPEPVSNFNHGMDAIRYAIDTHCRGQKEAFMMFSLEDAY